MTTELPWTLLSDDELRARLAQRGVKEHEIEWCVKGRDEGDSAIMSVVAEALGE